MNPDQLKAKIAELIQAEKTYLANANFTAGFRAALEAVLEAQTHPDLKVVTDPGSDPPATPE